MKQNKRFCKGPKYHMCCMEVFHVVKSQIKLHNARKDDWEIFIPLFINFILTAASL